MTVTIRLPTVLQRLANDQKEVPVEARDAGSALRALGQAHPALGQQLLDEDGSIRSFVKVFLDRDEIGDLDGEATALPEGATLRIVPAIAGGEPSDRRSG